ncbi:MAG TPA: peptidylprolyl isomerase [Nitrospirota bacterium]
MKALVQKFIFPLILVLAAGPAAFALGTQQPPAGGKSAETAPAVSSSDTGTAAAGGGFYLRVPLFSPRFARLPVAVVNDEEIGVEALRDALASSHGERETGQKGAEKIDYMKMVDRLINIRLIVQETTRMGLDELPEFKTAMDEFSNSTLRSMLKAEITRDVKADPEMVEKLYKKMAEEWKIKSVMFEKEEDAKAMADALKAGKSFDELAAKAIADKKAKGNEQGEFIKPQALLPAVAAALSTTSTGSVTPVVKIDLSQKKQGFVICRLEDKRYPDDPKLRKEAEELVLNTKKAEAAGQYMISLMDKRVSIKKGRVDDLDYESPRTNFDKMLADTKVIAEIEGDKPVTVGDLTAELEAKFYHGIEAVAREKKVNRAKREVLNKILENRLTKQEEAKRGLDKSEEYQKKMSEQRDSLLFGQFVEKAVLPSVKVTDQEIAAYFEGHRKDYQYPEMMKMTSMVFGDRNNAQSTIAKLRKGADIDWVRANAGGLVDPKDAETLSFEGSVLTTKNLPEGLRKSLAGAKAGDFRLYEAPNKQYCVVAVLSVIPAKSQPLEEVKEKIRQKLFYDHINQTVEDWSGKLRAAAKIEIYLQDIGTAAMSNRK